MRLAQCVLPRARHTIAIRSAQNSYEPLQCSCNNPWAISTRHSLAHRTHRSTPATGRRFRDQPPVAYKLDSTPPVTCHLRSHLCRPSLEAACDTYPAKRPIAYLSHTMPPRVGPLRSNSSTSRSSLATNPICPIDTLMQLAHRLQSPLTGWRRPSSPPLRCARVTTGPTGLLTS